MRKSAKILIRGWKATYTKKVKNKLFPLCNNKNVCTKQPSKLSTELNKYY